MISVPEKNKKKSGLHMASVFDFLRDFCQNGRYRPLKIGTYESLRISDLQAGGPWHNAPPLQYATVYMYIKLMLKSPNIKKFNCSNFSNLNIIALIWYSMKHNKIKQIFLEVVMVCPFSTSALCSTYRKSYFTDLI